MNGSHNTLLKVCKIDSISFASFAIKQNVDFLGVHVLSKNNIGEHREIVDFISSKGGKAIIVTKIQDIDLIKKLVEVYNPAGIQLHFEIQPQFVELVRQLFPGLKLFGVLTDDTEYSDFHTIENLFDFLIYDTSYKGGTNQENEYKLITKLSTSLKKKTLLAGGISASRISELTSLNPGGYDIQSYFRTISGLSYKNLEMVCDILKFPRKDMLSISLTDISLIEIKQASSYYINSNLEYHLDISSGSLYPSFNTIDKSIEEKQEYLAQFPCSIHLFMKNEEKVEEAIAKLISKYPLNITRIFVQYFDGIRQEIFANSSTDVKIIPSIFFKDLESYASQPIHSQTLSIIVPNPEDRDNIEVFFSNFLSLQEHFSGKEIWLDRNLNLDYIKLIRKRIGTGHNFIIGKEVIHDLNKINDIHEYLHK